MRGWFVAFVFGLLMASSGAARANVVFLWINDGPSNCCSGQIEITDAAYAAGVVNLDLDGDSGNPNPPPIASDLAVQSYTFFEGQTGKYTNFGPDFISCCQSIFDFTVVGDGLRGSIFVSDTSGYTGMAGDASLWQINISGSDATGPGCPAAGPCTGAGRWTLTSPPDSVPEPAAAFLLLAGLGGLTFSRRKRRQA